MTREAEGSGADTPAELQRRNAELSNLYEVARSLLGARDPDRIASRVVLAAMGTFGARAGAMFRVDARGRFRLAFHYVGDGLEYGETLRIEPAAREWMLREVAFVTDGAAAARGLGALRDRLVERYDAAVCAILSDPHGLAGLIVLGPRLLDEPYSGEDLAMFDSLASLAALALGSRIREEPETTRPQGTRRTERSLAALRAEHPPLAALVGASTGMLEACEDLVAVAPTRFPVLVTGESGVGKELAARAIHDMSERASGPFEVVDCGSIPRDLIESELFGHVRGAFTGAHRDRRGAFELAHRGTLFLDEVGEMPVQLQTRLLRVLQEGRFRRVGDEQLIETDVRVLAASNRDLRAEVAAKRFREDLFYRLNVFAVRVPPLRERLVDLPLLIRHFMPRRGNPGEGAVDRETLAALEAHGWPGNVRELANLCAALDVQTRGRGCVTLPDLEKVWHRQHGGDEPPWRASSGRSRGRLGEWVLEQARAHRFNLVEVARQLQRRKRAGQPTPLTERSAVSYYVTGEILRALAEAEGDAESAARAIAGDEDLLPRVAARVGKVIAALRACRGNPVLARSRFGKLPSGYEGMLERATRLVAPR